ncbi:TetR/AcrR family transcriptional regulator [Sphingobium sp. BYY-5]|uniref:TetR/AcrR family transcriptional regulator n=1 Tax=Sphingobium sp. BYY-5 TaxID=2926400 RepID=UPI001FA81062|nr:TetR/AcrR family transcriptional regulator [Sphingobium sp. BYY-5]MCI4589637.1 TetR/AcrR family transcriptional regulator [Sphingobium sp. BYY-5]
MKVSREQATRNREKVVDMASRLFRERGVEGVGIGEVMRECGLTHGGFYNQFASKEALAAEACATSLARSAEHWRAIVAEAENSDAPAAIAASYLSARNRDAPATGCSLIALGPDAARRGGDLAGAFRQGFEELTGILQESTPDMDRQTALARMAQMVGAMVLARGVADPALSEEILAAARKAIGLEA